MKSYLKQHPPIVSIALIALLFVAALLIAFAPSIRPYLILRSADLSSPAQWFKLVSYSLYSDSLQSWLVQSLILLFLGSVIEKKISKSAHIIALIIGASIIGGISYLLISAQGVALASPGMIVWGYCSAAIVLGLSGWQASESPERVALIASVLLLLWQLINFNLNVFLSQMIVMLLVGSFVWLGYGKNTAKVKQ
jgi:membrane associated rhomboid family serine protease